MEYVPRVPRAPLDGLIDDVYYLEGVPPYARLILQSAGVASTANNWYAADAAVQRGNAYPRLTEL